MASGQSVVEAVAVFQPTTLFATEGQRVGGSTPAEGPRIYRFPASESRYLDLLCRMGMNYDGGGLTVGLPWSASSATSGTCRWRAAPRRIADDAEAMGAAHTYDFNTVDDAPPSALGEVTDAVIAFTDGADMDGILAGEMFVLRLGRDISVGGNMAGDAELWVDLVTIRET